MTEICLRCGEAITDHSFGMVSCDCREIDKGSISQLIAQASDEKIKEEMDIKIIHDDEDN